MTDTTGEAPPSARGNLPPSIIFSLAAVYFFWGSTYLGVRVAVETIPPFYMAATRFLIAGSALYLFLRLRGHVHPTREQWLSSALLGGLLLVGGNGLVTLAQSLGVSSGMAAVVVSTMPLWLALFVRLQGNRIGWLGWVGMLIGLLGVALLNLGADLGASPLATTLLFIAPMSFALGSFWSPRLPQAKGLMASAAQMLTAGILFVLIGLARGEAFTHAPSPTSALALLYLIIFGSLLAYNAYTYLLSCNLRPTLLSSYAYVNPVVAVLLGVLLAGETVSGRGLLGMSVIVVGVALAVAARTRVSS
jgi:drug/metabolite transporter (DMT)-like permease